MPPALQVDLKPIDLESGVRVTCESRVPILVFLARPLCSRLRPDVHDRQTDVRQKYCLMQCPRLLGAEHNNNRVHTATYGYDVTTAYHYRGAGGGSDQGSVRA